MAPLLVCAATLLLGCSEGNDKESKDGKKAEDAVFFEAGSVDAAPADTASGPIDADAPKPLDAGADKDGFAPRWPDTGDCAVSCVTGDGETKVCGPDGCGSVCGFCKSGQFCAADQTSCGEFCKAKCAGLSCGPDGCGGQCGTCEKGFVCAKDGLCYEEDCTGSCVDRVCGDDGCGNSCGECAKVDYCDLTGQCKPGPCKGIPDTGKCDGAIFISCLGEGATATKNNADCGAKGQICGWDPVVGSNGCVDKGPCTPVCKTAAGQSKECGSDGCEGTCGKCPDGWSCPGGLCKPEKGAICGALVTAQGKCVGDEWIFCSGGKVAIIDCQSVSQTCGWNSSDAKFGCL